MIQNEIVKINRSVERTIYFSNKYFSTTISEILLQEYIDQLLDDIYVFIEYPYIDKLHRDSYYFYFSSKLKQFDRDTIRLSFFKKEVSFDNFKNKDDFKMLEEQFLGFLIIRPLEKCIGRNIISPYALKKRNFFIRTTEVNITVHGVKLFVEGFPHSSQDGESIMCAETTTWAMMEYFGTRYNDYSPILPSKIRNYLKEYRSDRLLPSSGLTRKEIPYLVNKFGFASRVYYRLSRNKKDTVFTEVLNCYIESGMPVYLGLVKGIHGHTTLCIGRKYIDYADLGKSDPIEINNSKIYDFDRAGREIIVMDDNFPPYQSTYPDNPISYHESETWKDYEIEYFVVPLHQKIYLEAPHAKKCLFSLFKTKLSPPFPKLEEDDKHFVRFFLTSSRSLKYNLACNKSFNSELKEIIINTLMPKFVWVAEVTSNKLLDKYKANGLVLIDATEPNITGLPLPPVIFAAYNGFYLEFDSEDIWKTKRIPLPLQPYYMFNDNLKLFKDEKVNNTRKVRTSKTT